MFEFCEQNLGGVISQPANTFSSVIYFFIGYQIFKKDKLLGVATLVLGITTIIFHATSSFIGQSLDLSSMLVLGALFVYRALPFKKTNSHDFAISIVLFILAFVFWTGDITKILCIPENHILTGHAIWHILTAFGIWFLYKSLEPKNKNNA
jgi:intracellular septation protein A